MFLSVMKLVSPTVPAEVGQSKQHIIPQGYAPYAYTETDAAIGEAEWDLMGDLRGRVTDPR